MNNVINTIIKNQSQSCQSVDKIIHEAFQKGIQYILFQRRRLANVNLYSSSSSIDANQDMIYTKSRKNDWFQLSMYDDISIRSEVNHLLKSQQDQDYHYLGIQLSFFISVDIDDDDDDDNNLYNNINKQTKSSTKRDIVLEKWIIRLQEQEQEINAQKTIESNQDEEWKYLYSTLITLFQQLSQKIANMPVTRLVNNENVALQHHLEICTRIKHEPFFLLQQNNCMLNSCIGDQEWSTIPVEIKQSSTQFTIHAEYLAWNSFKNFIPYTTVLGSRIIEDYQPQPQNIQQSPPPQTSSNITYSSKTSPIQIINPKTKVIKPHTNNNNNNSSSSSFSSPLSTSPLTQIKSNSISMNSPYFTPPSPLLSHLMLPLAPQLNNHHSKLINKVIVASSSSPYLSHSGDTNSNYLSSSNSSSSPFSSSKSSAHSPPSDLSPLILQKESNIISDNNTNTNNISLPSSFSSSSFKTLTDFLHKHHPSSISYSHHSGFLLQDLFYKIEKL